MGQKKAQTLPDVTPPKGKVQPFWNIAIHLENIIILYVLQDLECHKVMQHILFYDWKHYIKLSGVGGAMLSGEEENYLPNYLITAVFV